MEHMNDRGVLYRICTLVSDWGQYARMRESFEAAGFTGENSRYSTFDNSHGNEFEPYSLINRLIAETPEPYIVLCHQDVLADQGHGANQLTRVIAEMNCVDPEWGVLGNAGSTDDFDFVVRVVDPNRFDIWSGQLPVAVNSLDENFLVIRTAAGLRASVSLWGFHLYGTDLCLNARLRGRGCYVVDFLLSHLSTGTFGRDFFDSRERFIRRWNGEFHFLYVIRGAEVFLSRWSFLRRLGPKVRVKRLLMKNWFLRRLMTFELRPRRRGLAPLAVKPS
jgi:hypothetical protein